MSRVCFESWAKKLDGPRCLGAEVVVGPKCLNAYASYCLVSMKIRLKILLPYIYLRPKVTLHCVNTYVFLVFMRDKRKLYDIY